MQEIILCWRMTKAKPSYNDKCKMSDYLQKTSIRKLIQD